MNKHSTIGFILIFAIFIGYIWWISPNEEQRAEMQRKHDSIVAAYNDSVAQAAFEASERARLDSLARTGDTNAIRQLNKPTVQDMGVFNRCATGDKVQLDIDNGLMTVTLDNQGAMIKQVILSKYTTFDSLPLQLISPLEDNLYLNFSTQDNRVVNTKDLIFTPYIKNGNTLAKISQDNTLTIKKGDSLVVFMRADLGHDSAEATGSRYLDFRYTFYGDSYEVDFDIAFHGLDNIVRKVPYIDLVWQNGMRRQEKVDRSGKGSRNRNKDPERFNSNIYFKPSNDNVDHLKVGREDKKNMKSPLEWVAFKQQFFCAILMSDDTFENADLTLSTKTDDTSRNYLCDMSSTIGLTYTNGNSTMNMGFYFGPTKFRDLKAMDKGFEKMLPLGLWIFSKFVSRYVIIPVFNFLETFNWNYGIIILVLTFLMRLVLFPLTFKSYKSSAVMRILRPDMDAINKKYPKQEQFMQKQQEMSRLQKRAGINPAAGCLPLLIQLPILTAMFWFYPASIELRQKSFLWCNDLSTYDSILDFGFNIPLYGDHVSLFCLLMFGMQFFYTWYTMRSQEGQMTMPGMKFMMYFMPFMMLFLFNSQSAALNLYYFTSLSLTMLQMILIRRFTNEKNVRARMAAYDSKFSNSKKTQKKSKFQQRLEEMQKMTEEMQKQRNKR